MSIRHSTLKSYLTRIANEIRELEETFDELDTNKPRQRAKGREVLEQINTLEEMRTALLDLSKK